MCDECHTVFRDRSASANDEARLPKIFNQWVIIDSRFRFLEPQSNLLISTGYSRAHVFDEDGHTVKRAVRVCTAGGRCLDNIVKKLNHRIERWVLNGNCVCKLRHRFGY